MILYEQNGKTVAYELPDFEEPEEYTTFWQCRYELIQTDSSQVGDMFRWYFERDVDLSLLDKEAILDRMDDGPVKDEYARAIDIDCCPSRDIEYGVPSLSEAVNNYLEMYINKMTSGQLAVVMDCLEELMTTRKLEWWCYVRCGLAVSYRLAIITNKKAGWQDLLARFRKMNDINFRSIPVATIEDKPHASMTLDIEAAIDLKRKAEDLARLNYRSVESMMLCLLEEQDLILEEQSTDLLNLLGQQDEDQIDYEGYLDHLGV